MVLVEVVQAQQGQMLVLDRAAVLDVCLLFLVRPFITVAVGQVQTTMLTRQFLAALVAVVLGVMPTQQWALLRQTEP
jgi:hypothetical protein